MSQSKYNIVYDSIIPTDLVGLFSLYQSVGWTNYVNYPDKLMTALQNSTYVISSYHEGCLVELIRGMSDDVSLHFIQDILVRSTYQKNRIGRTLMKKALRLYPNIQKHLLLTDDERYQNIFYKSLSFKNLDLIQPKLNAYIQLKDDKILNKEAIP